METPFVKLEAAGNVYIAVDGRADPGRDWPALARDICRQHLGVGSDGLLVALASEVAEIRMRVFNSDGSEAEMSGNGVRLFAKYVLDRGLVALGEGSLVVQTGAGPRKVTPVFRDGRMLSGQVEMDVPRILDPSLRLALGGPGLESGSRSLVVTHLSLGNPHAVLLLDTPVEDFPLHDIGPRVERHPQFPGRTNFEVVNVLARDRLRVRVFERSEGETLSSGTGSTASAVAARLHGRTGDTVRVELPGGELSVTWPGEGRALLSGPTRELFEGCFAASAD